MLLYYNEQEQIFSPWKMNFPNLPETINVRVGGVSDRRVEENDEGPLILVNVKYFNMLGLE